MELDKLNKMRDFNKTLATTKEKKDESIKSENKSQSKSDEILNLDTVPTNSTEDTSEDITEEIKIESEFDKRLEAKDISKKSNNRKNKISVDSIFDNNYEKDIPSKSDIVKTMAKAATGNPFAVAKALKMASKHKKKKKSLFKRLFIIITFIMPLSFTLMIGMVVLYTIMTQSQINPLIDPNDIIANRYTEEQMQAQRGRDIMQKTFVDGDDATLPEETTEESKLYLKVTTSEVPYFSQHDPRWKDEEYCPGETYSQSACGVTSLAMLLTYLEYDKLDSDKDGVTLPTDAGTYSKNKGYATADGTLSNLYYNLDGLTGEYLSPVSDLARIKELLGKGTPLIYSVNGSQTFAYSHLMVATGYKDGKWTVNDPDSFEKSNKEWDETAFLSGALYFVYLHK